MAWLSRWFRTVLRLPRDTGPEAEEVKALSDQFFVTLQACVSKVGASPDVLERIKEILKKKDEEWSWKDAYEVEQHVVLLFDPETLKTELGRRTLEAQGILHPEVAQWYQAQLADTKQEVEQRALLLRLVNDLQWRYTVNEAKRGYIKQITSRTGWIFIGAMVVFVGSVIALVQDLVPTVGQPTKLLLLSGVSGFWGAAFSMLAGLKARLDESRFNDLKIARSRALLFARVLVGTGAALILFFFFDSGLLDGSAFPDVTADATNAEPQNLALLIVWSFLAGFSEKLVPGLLAKTEGSVGDHPQTLTHQPPRPSETVVPPARGGRAPSDAQRAEESNDDGQAGVMRR